ncbi:hypothetical protein [Nonomuraea sp. NPDC050310]|uniref:hypothetical protein n=1 Tax=unclassified Nonomuraea TaxID=2593643 RepID=UPI0033CBE996
MPSLAISTSGLIVVTILVTALLLALIMLAVRFVHRPPTTAPSGELLERIRDLKARGLVQDAVLLVRGEAGMSHRAAVRFVRRL